MGPITGGIKHRLLGRRTHNPVSVATELSGLKFKRKFHLILNRNRHVSNTGL